MSINMELTTNEFCDIVTSIEKEVGKVIVGQKQVIQHVLISILSGGHVLLEGVPGLGKTMLIKTLGQVLDLQFSRIQFTPDMMPADITGTNIMEENDEGRRSFRFQKGPIFSSLILADEINRATPKTQSALLEAMQERTVTVTTETYSLPSPFFVMATQNPLEMEGTYPLPEAQLDRFMFKVDVPFPSPEELNEILRRTTGEGESNLSAVSTGERILAMQSLARHVPVPSHVNDYVGKVITASHPEGSCSDLVMRYVRYGSSPRGGQALLLGAKVRALLAGRFNVGFDDIIEVASASLRHRLILNFEGQAEGIRTDDVINEIITAVPRQ